MASAARVHAVERGDVVNESHADRLRRRARRCMPRASPRSSACARARAAQCRRRLGGRLPRGADFLRAGASSRHMRLDAFDFAGASRAARRDERGGDARWSSRARAARRSSSGASPTCAMSGRGTRSRCRCRVRDLTAADAEALRETFERDYAVLFRRPIPGAAIEVAELVGARSRPRRKLPAAHGAGARRSARPRRTASGRCSTAAAAAPSRCRSIAASALPPGARVPGPGDHRRGRDLDLRLSASFDARYRCRRAVS